MSKSIAEIARHPMRLGAIVALVVAVAMLALFLARLDTEAVHNDGLLEMDGNTAFNGGCGFDLPPAGGACTDNAITTSATFDWEDVCQRTSAADHTITEKPVLPTGIDHTICTPDFPQPDASYHTGSDKDYQDISGPEPVWHCKEQGNATNKADLLNSYTALGTNGSGDQILYFGAERDSENGDVFNGFWFLQSAASVVTPCGTSTNFSGVHTCGDILILLNYTSGGRIGTTSAYQWQPGFSTSNVGCDGTAATGDECPFPVDPDSHDPLCLIKTTSSGDCRVAGANDPLCGRVNGATDCVVRPSHNDPTPPPCSGPGAFSTPWDPKDSPNSLAPPTFSEAGVNLTDLGVALPCISAFVAETRSSPSVTATLKDFTLRPTGEDCGSGITTEIHSEADNSDPDLQGTTVDEGTVIHDVGILTPSGPSGAPNATGTITFERWDVGDCGAAGGELPVSSEDVAVSPGVPVNTSGSFDSSDFDTTGSVPNISYKASYDADSPYTDSTSACETLHIIYSPSIVTDPTPDEGHVGDVLDDTATLSGGFSPTGSILFELFPPSDPTCSGTPVFSESVTVSGNGSYSTTTDSDYQAAVSGTYQWVATYSGDTDNNPASSDCGDEAVVIINPSTILTKSASPSVVTTVTYTYTEENDGDVDLTSPTVSDPDCEANGGTVAYASGDDGDGILNSGETWTFTCTATYNGPGSFTDTATGSGVDPQLFTVTYCVTPPNGTTICDAEERDSRTVTVSVDVS